MKKDTGGPAFPIVGQWGVTSQGLTIRDYFAAKAMQGFAMGDILCKEASTAPEWFENIAEAAYDVADAMLKAREA